MKKIYLVFFVLTAFIVPYYLTAQTVENFRQEGIASWYGREFEGRPTASGEIFDSSKLTAAHPTLPFGTWLLVTNLHNNKNVTVRVNDRGPFVAARIIDVSRAAAEQLDMIATGTAPVLIESITVAAVSSTSSVQTQTVTPSAPPVTQPAVTPREAAVQPVNTVLYVSQPVVQAPNQIRLMPEINIDANKTYRLQVGSYRIARNAVEAFEKLKNSGLNPSYERYLNGENGEYFRVVLAGVRGTDVQITAGRLQEAGFREAIIREEN
jgi:rare lipoprotein A